MSPAVRAWARADRRRRGPAPRRSSTPAARRALTLRGALEDHEREPRRLESRARPRARRAGHRARHRTRGRRCKPERDRVCRADGMRRSDRRRRAPARSVRRRERARRLDREMATLGITSPTCRRSRTRSLFRWEAHTLALAAWIAVTGRSTTRCARSRHSAMASPVARCGSGISEVVMFWRYRDEEHYDREATVELAQFCAERVDRPIGRHAARIVVALVEGKAVAVTAVRDRVLDRIADADAETREYAARLVRLDGVPAPRRRRARAGLRGSDRDDPQDHRPRRARPVVRAPRSPRSSRRPCSRCSCSARAASCSSPSSSIDWRQAPRRSAASAADPREHPAVGRPGCDRTCPRRSPASRSCRRRGGSTSTSRSRRAASPARSTPRSRPRGPKRATGTSDATTGRRSRAVAEPLTCALALADSPHHHAYQRAVEPVDLGEPSIGSGELDALARFLEVDGDRPLHLRRAAAVRLAQTGDHARHAAARRADARRASDRIGRMFSPITRSRRRWRVVDAALIGGPARQSEKRMWQVIERRAQGRRAGPRCTRSTCASSTRR